MNEGLPSNEFEEIPEITPSGNTDLKSYTNAVYERSPKVHHAKEDFVRFLNMPSFDVEVLAKSIERWNQSTEEKIGYVKPYLTLEEIETPHGRLDVIHYKTSDSVKFVFTPR